MWYVVAADKRAHLRSGFSKQVTPAEYAASVADNTITDILADYQIHPGDVFFPAGGPRNSIGAGAYIAEIQQTSNITYRIYDFNRRDATATPRTAHRAGQGGHRLHRAARLPDALHPGAEQPRGAGFVPLFPTSLLDLPPLRRWSSPTSTRSSWPSASRAAARRRRQRQKRFPMHQGETEFDPRFGPVARVPPDSAIELLTSWIARPASGIPARSNNTIPESLPFFPKPGFFRAPGCKSAFFQ